MFIESVRQKLIAMTLIVMLLVAVTTSCGSAATDSSETSTASTISVKFNSNDLDSSWDLTDAAQIILKDDNISVQGSGASVDGNTLTITSGGIYILSGTLNDGQIVVDSSDENVVKLVLNGVSISDLDSAPIYVKSAKKAVITLADGSHNTLTDAETYVYADAATDEPDAALYSKDDLTINGSGSLTVNGNYKGGIVGKDKLKIVSGTITVKAVSDGIKGKDCVAVKDGVIVVEAGKDGVQASNDEDTSKGFVYIEAGRLEVKAGYDGIQAETSVLVKDGEINLSTGGGSTSSNSQGQIPQPGMMGDSAISSDSESMKGIKAGVNITIDGGNMLLDTADDAIHADDSIVINDGTLAINAGDDGIHAESTLALNGGDVTISKSYEGLEAASIIVNDGSYHVVASDDGINTVSADDETTSSISTTANTTISKNKSTMRVPEFPANATRASGAPGNGTGFPSNPSNPGTSPVNGPGNGNDMNANDGSKLNINGGYVYIDAGGDGIDVNGDFVMSNGTVIVNGPTNDGNGALDYNGSFTMDGGFLVAAGSSGMVQAPGQNSSQSSLNVKFTAQQAGTMVAIQNAAGENVLTFVPSKQYASVVFSSPELKTGSYTVYSGGTSTGTVKDGLYSNGVYTPGTKLTMVSLTPSGSSSGSGTNPGIIPGSNSGDTGPGSGWGNRTNIDRFKSWTILFNKMVDSATINNQNITVTDADNEQVDVEVTTGDDGQSAIVSAPEGGYSPGQTYTLNISDQIKSSSGIVINHANQMQFTIAALA